MKHKSAGEPGPGRRASRHPAGSAAVLPSATNIITIITTTTTTIIITITITIIIIIIIVITIITITGEAGSAAVLPSATKLRSSLARIAQLAEGSALKCGRSEVRIPDWAGYG